MLNIKYALEKNGPKRLEIAWQINHTEFHIRLDGNEVASFNSPELLREGQEFVLNDGSRLKVKIIGHSKILPFEVTRNGEPLPSNMPTPADRLKTTCRLLNIIACMNIMGGLTSYMSSFRLKLISHNGWILIVVGLILFLMNLCIKRKSKIALIIVTSVFAMDTIAFPFYASFLPLWGKILIFILRLLLVMAMLDGISAINQLKLVESDRINKDK